MKKLQKITFSFTYIWLLSWSINLFGSSTDIAIVGGVIIIIMNLLLKKNITTHYLKNILLLFLFGASYSIILNIHKNSSYIYIVRESIIPVILYSVGYLSYSTNISSTQNENVYIKSIRTIASGLFIYAMLNIIVHLNNYGQIVLSNRLILDIWSGGLIQATAQGSKLILFVSLLISMLVSNMKMSKIGKLLIVLGAISGIIASLIMANRSIFVIIVFSFVMSLVYSTYLYSNDVRKTIKIILYILLLFLVAFFVYENNLFDLKTSIEQSNLVRRLSQVSDGLIDNNPRIKAWLDTLNDLFVYPLGGEKANIGTISSPHNLWFDVGYTTGIIPFFLLCLVTLQYAKYLISLTNLKTITKETKIYIFSLSISLCINMFIEPVLDGHYYLYMTFIFQLGLMHGLLYNRKNAEIINEGIYNDK